MSEQQTIVSGMHQEPDGEWFGEAQFVPDSAASLHEVLYRGAEREYHADREAGSAFERRLASEAITNSKELFFTPVPNVAPAGYEGIRALSDDVIDARKTEAARQIVTQAAEAVRGFLEERGHDLSDVFLWGYDPSKQKPSGDEHDLGDGKRRMSLASIEDMNTRSLDEDEEIVGEAWMVNPLKYALEGGALRVFSRAMLTPYIEAEDEEFGTVAVAVTDEQLQAAMIEDLRVKVVNGVVTLEAL